MIGFLRGIFFERGDDYLLMDVGGIGYRVFVPATIFHKIGKKGDEIILYTYLSVRDDAMILYGFPDMKSLSLYRSLLRVSGIGPKVGVALFSALSSEEIANAIIAKDYKPLTAASGVGPKLAKKIVLELAGHLDLDDETGKAGQDKADPAAGQTAQDEVQQALLAMGFSNNEAKRAMDGIKDRPEYAGGDIKAMLKLALKEMGKR